MRKFQHHRNFSTQEEVEVCSYPFGGWNNSNLFYPESTVRFCDILLVVFCVFPIANLTRKQLYRLKKVFIVLIKFLDGRKPCYEILRENPPLIFTFYLEIVKVIPCNLLSSCPLSSHVKTGKLK